MAAPAVIPASSSDAVALSGTAAFGVAEIAGLVERVGEKDWARAGVAADVANRSAAMKVECFMMDTSATGRGRLVGPSVLLRSKNLFRTLLAAVILLTATPSPGQEPPLPATRPQTVTVAVRVAVPPGTTGAVFVAGSVPQLGPWRADALRLTRSGEAYVGSFAVEPGVRVEFKFTRGSWESVEKSAAGEEVANRTYDVPADGSPARIEAAVARWASAADAPATRRSTVVGTLKLHDGFESKALGNRRTIRVWLPPGYDASPDTRYPVVYLHDGQNCFDAATSSFGTEWGFDESATRLIEAGRLRPVILVGIDNTPARRSEYTLDVTPMGGGQAEAYGRFVVEEVRPFIDATYRTQTGREHTYTAGSSLGGVVSLELLSRYPQLFGGAGVVSPALWWADRAMVKRVEAATWTVPPGTRVWLDMGTREGPPGQWGAYVVDARRLRDALAAKGLAEGKTLAYLEAEGAEHNEAAWARRAGDVLTFLVGR